MKIFIGFLLVFSFSLQLPDVQSATYRTGGQCHILIYENKLDKAAEVCKKEAESGNRTAMYNYGLMFARGHGVKTDYKKAIHWYLKAAKNNHAAAMFNLGHMYYSGKGVKKDFKKYIEWNSKAAELDYAPAYKNIATMHMEGGLLEKNNVLVMKNLRKAALFGETSSIYNYGLFLLQGYAGESKHEGIIWILASYELGFPEQEVTTKEIHEGYSAENLSKIKMAKEKLVKIIRNNIISLKKKNL